MSYLKQMLYGIFGNYSKVKYLLENKSRKMLFRMYLYTFLFSMFAVALLSILTINISKNLTGYLDTLQTLGINLTSINLFSAKASIHIPLLFVFAFLLFLISLLFYGLSRLMGSEVNLENAIYSLQFILPAYPISLFLYTLLIFTAINLPILAAVITILYFIFILFLFYRIGKLFSYISGISSIPYIFSLLIILSVFIILAYFQLMSIYEQIPLELIQSVTEQNITLQ